MSWQHRFLRFLSDTVLPWTAALAVHAALLAALTFSLGWQRDEAPAVAAGGPKIEAIEAVVVDSAMLDAEVDRLAAQERAREQALAAQQKAIRDAQLAQEREAERLRQLQVEREAAARKQREEQARLQQLQREAEQAQARARAEEQAREEARLAAEAEARRLAEEEARREAEREAKRRAEEQARLAREAEARRREEERRRAEQARVRRQQEEAESLLLAALAEEEDRQAKVNAGLLAQYKAQVKQKVERNWARPPEAQTGLSCEVTVRQLRDGQVITVEFGRCNGNDAVKRSIEGAVNRASPLPPPPDPSLFDEYVVFIFEPE